MQNKITTIREFSIVTLLCSVCLLITPWNNLEPIVLPKFATLLPMGIWIIGLGIMSLHRTIFLTDKVVSLTIIGAFLILVNPIWNSTNIIERIIGTYGRNLGLLTFLVSFLLVIPALLYREEKNRVLQLCFLLTNSLMAIYFYVQLADRDPAQWVYVYGDTPNTTLGNPNFVSAHFAIASIVSLAMAMNYKRAKWYLRLICGLTSLPFAFIVLKANSSQGYLIMTVLAAFLFFFRIADWLRDRRGGNLLPKIWHFLSVGLMAIFLITLLLSSSRFIGFLGARPEYWSNGISQILDSPIWGQGFDQYGDNYMLFKNPAKVNFADSPHNLLIDLGVSGGLPLLLVYIAIQFMVLCRFLKFRKSKSEENRRGIELLFLMWLGFHLQSFVNPTTLPFLTLGFLLTGMLLGQLGQFSGSKIYFRGSSAAQVKSGKIGFAKILAGSLFFFGIMPASVYLGTAPLMKDAAFRDAAELGDGAKLIAATQKWPFNSRLSLETAKVLEENKYNYLALSVLRDLVKHNPKSRNGWIYIYRFSNNPSEKSTALQRILELDPSNPEFKQLDP